MRASSHRNIAHKEETDRWSSQQRIPHHWRGGEGGEMETERADDKILACVPVQICVQCTNQLNSHI